MDELYASSLTEALAFTGNKSSTRAFRELSQIWLRDDLFPSTSHGEDASSSNIISGALSLAPIGPEAPLQVLMGTMFQAHSSVPGQSERARGQSQ